jgi:hypothetical protein
MSELNPKRGPFSFRPFWSLLPPPSTVFNIGTDNKLTCVYRNTDLKLGPGVSLAVVNNNGSNQLDYSVPVSNEVYNMGTDKITSVYRNNDLKLGLGVSLAVVNNNGSNQLVYSVSGSIEVFNIGTDRLTSVYRNNDLKLGPGVCIVKDNNCKNDKSKKYRETMGSSLNIRQMARKVFYECLAGLAS